MKKYFFSTQPAVDPPVGETVDVPLAQTGEGIAECELLKWFVQEVSEWVLYWCYITSSNVYT